MNEEIKRLKNVIKEIHDIVQFCSFNGLLNYDDTYTILNLLVDAEGSLEGQSQSLADAKKKINEAYCRFTSGVNSANLRNRLLYMYALHVWLFLIVLTVLFALFLYSRILHEVIIGDSGVSMEVLVWGGFGGVSYSLFYLRKNVYSIQFSKLYAIYYLVYPFSGMLFGAAMVMVIEAGLLIVQAKLSYVVHAAVAFLAGLLQSWTLNTLKRISEAIQKE